MEHLKSKQIGCEVYYPLTLPQQACFADLPCVDERFPSSETAAEQTLAIPIFPELRPEQIEEVVSGIRAAL
jgi:dTDP-4-amino-4,6-dideoxygalactose transaminase